MCFRLIGAILATILILLSAPKGAFAQTDVCSVQLAADASDSSPEIQAASLQMCAAHWDGSLPATGQLARVRADVDVTLPDGFLDEVVDALQNADRASPLLGDLQAHRAIEVLVLEPGAVWGAAEDESYAAAFTTGSVCHVLLYENAWVDPIGRELLRFTIAHEFFHCLQRVNIPAAYRPDMSWAIEGSANWFGHLAVPDTPHDWAPTFEENISRVPLSDQSYASWVFFSWLHMMNGPEIVMDYLQFIAENGPTPPELLASLQDETWGDFAYFYVSRFIVSPDGRPINPPIRDEIETFVMPEGQEEADLSLTRAPAVLLRHHVTLGAGVWRITGERGTYATFVPVDDTGHPMRGAREMGDGWFEVEVTCGEEQTFLTTTFGLVEDAYLLNIRKVDETCAGNCETVPRQTNQCLIGTWEVQNAAQDFRNSPFVGMMQMFAMIGGGNLEVVDIHAETFAFRADGSFTNNRPLTFAGSLPEGVEMELDVTVNEDIGRWGVTGSRLQVCTQRNRFVATISGSAPEAGSGSEDIRSDELVDEPPARAQFTCDGDTLSLRYRASAFFSGAPVTLRRLE